MLDILPKCITIAEKSPKIVDELELYMLLLEKNARKILTDSGGVQKEAYMLKVACITMRDETEWVETVEDGWNLLVGADKNNIVEAACEFEPAKGRRDVFGLGDASVRMIQKISG